jgi:hypothetical protein
LEPDLYIDVSSTRVLQMKAFVPHVVCVSSDTNVMSQLQQEASQRVSVVQVPQAISDSYG